MPKATTSIAGIDEKLWTSLEVAERLRVHVESVRRWVRLGELKAIRLGGPVGDRFPESEIQRFMATKLRRPKALAS